MVKAPPRVCIDCRTLIGAELECDLSRFHRVVALDSEEGRARMSAQVWGPPELRRRALEAARVGGLGAFLDGVSCGGCPADLAVGGLEGLVFVLVSLVLVFLVVAAIYWVIAASIAWIRRRRDRLRPTGIDFAGGRGERVVGEVIAGGSVKPPIGTGEGVAWGVVLDSSDAIGAASHLLFAGASGGFRVALEDGRVLEVPAGRARVEPRSGSWERASSTSARAFAAELDGRAGIDDPHPPIPADRARSIVVKIGDRVAVVAPTELAAADGGGYREGASILRARGVPVIAALS